ncbi:MAG: type II toxin-antitoxin system VapC family toxin [Deltaproteobacteria bacterium]|nr:type II toxin-antitoxin system VapC family toxin [Deltaproteobacteria bacterium]
MRYLLDTHALLWWIFDDPKLPSAVRQIVADPNNDILVSSASAWEIATKHRLGKLDAAKVLVRDISGWVSKAGFSELPVTIAHAQRAGSWLQAHRDPFDRMLAAQSAIEEVPLMTADRAIHLFGVQIAWPG